MLNKSKQVYQLKCLIEEMIAEGKTDEEIARLLLEMHPSPTIEKLVAIIRKLDKDLTMAYEEAAGEDL